MPTPVTGRQHWFDVLSYRHPVPSKMYFWHVFVFVFSYICHVFVFVILFVLVFVFVFGSGITKGARHSSIDTLSSVPPPTSKWHQCTHNFSPRAKTINDFCRWNSIMSCYFQLHRQLKVGAKLREPIWNSCKFSDKSAKTRNPRFTGGALLMRWWSNILHNTNLAKTANLTKV